MKIQRVGVIGCGQMGSGIVEVCARAGYAVVVSEVNDTLLKKGLGNIDASLSRAVGKGKMEAQEKAAIMGRISGTTRLDDFKDCDLTIEVVVESMNEKKRVFSTLDRICRPEAILATNTSCLSVTEMAMSTKRAGKVLGIHFFNPAPVMKLVELVRTIVCSEETIRVARDFAVSLGKTPVMAPDMPGFIVNRLLIPYELDAIRLLESGVATKEDIDQAVSLGLNHPMGPLALCDLIGLDVIHFVASALYDEFKEPRYASPILLKKMVLAGQLGRKTGKGFYEYK